MQVFAFFLAFFSSVSWLIYALLFARSKLAAEGLWEQSPEMMLILLTVVFLPLLVVWMIFGFVNQYINNRMINRKQSELLTQLQKNQDYTDLVVRVMLDAEHEIKDGFVINKFEVLISDMNEALSEIIQRCNIASSAQLEQLWQRVGRGERWTLGKAVLEASKSRSTFDAWVHEKVGRDKVFRGALLEFCSRYQNLLQLLEKHDRDRIFIRMIEMGVFGKVYSIIAPLASGTDGLSADKQDNLHTSSDWSDKNDYASVLKLATMEEPNAQNSIMNVDKNDEENNDDDEELVEEKSSIFSRFKLFRRKEDEEQKTSITDQDPFFQALHNSFQSESDTKEPSFSATADFEHDDEPHLSSVSSHTEGTVANTLTATRDSGFDDVSASTADMQKEPTLQSGAGDFAARLAAVRQEAIQSAGVATAQSAEKQTVPEPVSADKDDEDLVYPFGGWTDENNYGQ